MPKERQDQSLSKLAEKIVSPTLPINQIECDDALKVMSQWESHSIDACITDPPYSIAKKSKGLAWAFSSHVTMDSAWDVFSQDEYIDFSSAWLSQVCRVTKKNGNIFVFGSYHNIYLIGAIAQKFNLRIVNSIIWAKPNAQPNITCRMFTESTEQIIWLCNNDARKASNWTFNYQAMKELNDGKQMRNFWVIPQAPKSERTHGKHPSQKPLAVMERLVLAGTNPGDVVLDCFSGSGSTLLACQKWGRHYVGIEKNPDYCEIAHKRLARP
jgi:DNA modification methylase